ncbi:hypothetical protein K488DRAFT_85252 [Vararia minispora EC-137]|uniref:Uncharacterized protein n=1 Tax=Vararia minispora EC-137 TaxID=1314806 RepID=A0ACB8QMZ4_9AGAM|nr:hypothetical protein K488DRAFT_85252 [Vararia minispora EC-137]
MNVAVIQRPTAAPQVQRTNNEAEDTTPDFLSVKLINKRARVKISPNPLNLDAFPSKGQLLAVSNIFRWFAAIAHHDSGPVLVFSPLDDLRAQLATADGKSQNIFAGLRSFPLTIGTPNYITFAYNDTRLLVALVQGPILVYDATALCSPGGEVSPLHHFPPTTATAVRQMYANPGDLADLVVILREPDGSPDSQLVEVVSVSSLQSVGGWRGGGTSDTFPTSVSWSPKGKQLAIALQSGDIITFSPSDTTSLKTFVPRPPTANNQSIIHTTWLSNPAFYSIFAPPGPLDPQSDLAHFVISYDSKRQQAADVRLPLSFFASGLRPPGAFTITLRSWEPAKIMLVVGDSTTADIGIVGLISADGGTGEIWQRLSLEDAATPSMPLDADSQETVMLGFELDLHNATPYSITTASGEVREVPPPPIMYAYASDGTILGWYIINTLGTPYPGMGSAANTAVASPSITVTASASPAAAGTPPMFGGSQPTPVFGQAQVPSPFSQPSFGQPAFGQRGFGNSGGAFGSAGFGSAQQPLAFDAASGSTSGGGFANFASQGTSNFGGGFGVTQGGGPFGSGGSTFGSSPTPAPAIEQSRSTDMMDDTATGDEPSFGGLSLGGSSQPAEPKQGGGIFGTAATQPSSGSAPSQFGSDGAFGGGGGGAFGGSKLAPGHGLFAKMEEQAKQELASTPTVSPAPVQPNPAFGQSGFGQSSFGQTGFGKPAFGQATFGKPAFGQSGFGAGSPMSTTPVSATANSGGGFAAFASGTGGFGTGAKPQTLAGGSGGSSRGFGSFAGSGTSGFGEVKTGGETGTPVWKSAGGDQTDMKPAPVFGVQSTPVFGAPSFGQQSAAMPVTGSAGSTAPAFDTARSTPTTPAPTTPTPASALSTLGQLTTSPPFDAKPAPTTTTLSASPFAAATAATVPTGALPRQLAFGSPASGPPSPVSPVSPVSPSSPAMPVPSITTTPAGPPPASAFAGIQTRSSPFAGLGSGAFGGGGAFGNTFRKDSPFAKPKPVGEPTAFSGDVKPASAFAQAGAPAFGLASFGGSVFGQTSVLGARSPFGKKPDDAPQSTTPAGTPSAGAFSEFSGQKNAFGTAGGVGTGRSFSDLLKGDVEKKGDEGKDKEKPRSAFPPVKPALSASTGEEGREKTQRAGKEESFENLSASSSFVDVSKEVAEEDEDKHQGEEEDESEEGEDGEPGQSIDDFLSDQGEEDRDTGEGSEPLEELSGSEANEEEDEEGEEDEVSQAAFVALPESRSPSTTPKPTFRVQPATPEKSSVTPPKTSTSTTPPGSPSPLMAPIPVAAPVSRSGSISPSPSAPGSLGLGRPSTRPARSSPLANSVSVGDDAAGPEPVPPKPRPASPKTSFGTLPSKIPVPLFQLKSEPLEDNEEKTSPITERPKTPPAASLFGFGKEDETPKGQETKHESPAPGPSVPKAPSIFGAMPPPPSGLNLIPASKTPVSASSIFKAPSPPVFNASSLPQSAANTLSPLSLDLQSGSQARGAGTMRPAPAPAVRTEAPTEQLHPLQKEFLHLFATLGKELESLGALAKEAGLRAQMLVRPPPQANVLRMEDIQRLGKDAKSVVDDLAYLETSNMEDLDVVHELEAGVLRAKTRLEFIARFNDANASDQFTKMQKLKSLDPDHVENQAQLRRKIRTINERLTEVEVTLQDKKRLFEQLRTGKGRIRPPSIDTINRTFRNIDVAIEHQLKDIKTLSTRLSKLDIADTPERVIRGNTPRGRNVPDRSTPEPFQPPPRQLTTSIAQRAAAALSAERSAHRLHAALVQTRTEPLLNTQAVGAPAARHVFVSAHKALPTPAIVASSDSFFSTPFTLPPFPEELTPHVGPAGFHRRTSQTGAAKHQKPVAFKGESPSPSQSPAFDWGPLPKVPPKTSLAADLRTPPKS